MAKGLTLDIAANTRQFIAGTKDIEAALDKTADSLDDLTAQSGRSADKAGDAIADGFEDGAREAARSAEKAGDAIADGVEDGARDAARAIEQQLEGALDDLASDARKAADDAGDNLAEGVEDGAKDASDALEKVEKSFREVAAAARKETADMGTDLGTSVRKGTDEAGEGLSEFRDEANSTAKESAASFDGSAESIVDSFQEIAANAFAGFGPAGAIAGLAIAAGIGLGAAGIEKNKERTEELEQKTSDLADQYIEVGATGRQSMSGIADEVRELATATGDGELNLSDLRETAEKTGLPFERLGLAMAGDRDELERLIESTTKHIDAIDEQQQSSYQGAAGFARASSEAERQRDALLELRGQLQDTKTMTDDAAEASRLYAEVDDGLAEKAANAEDYAETLQGAYAEAGSSIEEFFKDGKFNLDAYNAEMEASAAAINNYQTNVVAASEYLSDEALAYIQSLGPDAAPALQAFIDAPLDQKQRTANNWDAIGQTSSSAFKNKMTNDLSGASFASTVVMNPDMSRIAAELARTRTINILARISNSQDLPGSNPARNGMGVP